MGWPPPTEREPRFVDDEVEGDLAGLAVFDDEVGMVDIDDADEDVDFAVAVAADVGHVGALIFGTAGGWRGR